MKKIILLTFITILSISNINAQERSSGDIEIVPYVGYMTAFVNGDFGDAQASRTSARFGVLLDYYFNDRWSFRSGLAYDSMGADDGFNELEINYINIPLNANWHFGSTRKWNLNFGLTPGFSVSAELDGIDVSDAVASFQLGISYGIGYKLEISDSFSLLFDAYGLVAVTDYTSQDDSVDRYNAGSGFNIGAVFKL